MSGWLLAGLLATTTVAETKKLNSVALTVGDLGNPFFVQIAHGAETRAKQINDKVKFTSLSSNYDVNNQTNQIDNFISSNVNLILLGAADSKGIAPAVMRAKQAGITVVAVDVGAVGHHRARRPGGIARIVIEIGVVDIVQGVPFDRNIFRLLARYQGPRGWPPHRSHSRRFRPH